MSMGLLIGKKKQTPWQRVLFKKFSLTMKLLCKPVQVNKALYKGTECHQLIFCPSLLTYAVRDHLQEVLCEQQVSEGQQAAQLRGQLLQAVL